jgi:hypothetical protein
VEATQFPHDKLQHVTEQHGSQQRHSLGPANLATVVVARRGPTISSRLIALVNQALYDTWAAFDPKAWGFTVDLYARAFRVDGLNSSSELVAASMAQAATGVLRSVGAGLFANQTLPPELASAIDAAKTVAMSTLTRACQQQVSRLAAAQQSRRRCSGSA